MGKVKSTKKLIDLTGMRFGRLTVLRRSNIIIGASIDQIGQRPWICQCDCGVVCKIRSGELRYGKAISCGCFNKEKNIKHGHASRTRGRSRTYRIWIQMWQRCTNPNSDSWNRYGGRGITVCERWQDFDAFVEDIGLCPDNELTLDRKDNYKGYSPDNCRWATRLQQTLNRRPRSEWNFKQKGLR